MIIKKSENQDIEFKQSWQDEYLKWICAFTNTKGGILYIGVNDKGTVTGVQDFHKLSETIPLKIHRAETYFFPRGAFRELLLNALIHKDYTKPYPIQILIYKDKIDIWNIGEMPETVKIVDLYKLHHSAPRNPKIADIFFKCGFIESWGRGYFKIKTICEEQNATLPEPKVVSGGFSAICNASETYKKLAAEYGIDGFTESAQKNSEKVPRKFREVLLLYLKQ